MSDDVIAWDLWFAPPQSKILATPMQWHFQVKIVYLKKILVNTNQRPEFSDTMNFGLKVR